MQYGPHCPPLPLVEAKGHLEPPIALFSLKTARPLVLLQQNGGYPEDRLRHLSLVGSQNPSCGTLVCSNNSEIPYTVRNMGHMGPSREVKGHLESPFGRIFP